MREERLDIFTVMAEANITPPAQHTAICITTNGTIKRNREAVLGAGVAKRAMTQWPQLPRMIGQWLETCGGAGPQIFVIPPLSLKFQPLALVSVPVKYEWHETASLELIAQSCRALVDAADLFGWQRVILPRPGCGNGKRTWDEVFPIVQTLDDRFVLVTL